MALDLYHALGQINRIKRMDLVLPIAKRDVTVSPLSVGDDLTLKTALISPVRLDKELMKLLWQHTEFWIPNSTNTDLKVENPDNIQGIPTKRGRKKKTSTDQTGGSYKRLSENDFYNNISYYDKLVLMWGIYKVTYDSLGVQEVECPNCNTKFSVDIYLDDTMHDDSLTIFEEEEPFNKYSEVITIPYGNDFNLDFTIYIPSMADFNRLLGLIPAPELQQNLESIRSQFNTEQLMALYTKKLAVYPKDKPEERAESSVTREILSSIRDFVNIEISNEFFKEYSNRFSKYGVNFYKECECPNCKEKNNLGVDIEYEFFRRQLPR